MKCAFAWLLVLASVCSLAFTGEPAQLPKHLEAAKNLVKNIDPDNNGYNHGGAKVSFAAPYEMHADCSGFIDALLMYSYGYSPDQLKTWLGSKRPTAHRYYEKIKAEIGFTHIKHMTDVRPGDILAIKFFVPNKNTGHIMLVAESPKKRTATAPIIDGTNQWEVRIIDSTGPPTARPTRGMRRARTARTTLAWARACCESIPISKSRLPVIPGAPVPAQNSRIRRTSVWSPAGSSRDSNLKGR